MAGLSRQVFDRWRRDQEAVCERFRVEWVDSPPGMKLGVARNVRSGLAPFNGLRHPPQGDTTGWYLWAGEELSQASDFFVPLHVEHLADWCPAAIPYLGLRPGWRFLIAPGHEDVWFDDSLLNI
jgi:hypothetical protein